MELNVDISSTKAQGFFKIGDQRVEELQKISLGILEQDTGIEVGERIANALGICESENERMYLCNCIGTMMTARVAAMARSDSNLTRPVAVHLSYLADSISLIAHIADTKNGDPFVINSLIRMREILDEVIATNLDPNPLLLRDILDSAMRFKK